jgi:hypothetical protein
VISTWLKADVLQIAPELASVLGGKFVLLDEGNKIGRVVLPKQPGLSAKEQWYVDFSTLAGDIHQDLARRDFTIDAMAIDLRLLNEYCSEFKTPHFNHLPQGERKWKDNTLPQGRRNGRCESESWSL